jgi:hypothetical protein
MEKSKRGPPEGRAGTYPFTAVREDGDEFGLLGTAIGAILTLNKGVQNRPEMGHPTVVIMY